MEVLCYDESEELEMSCCVQSFNDWYVPKLAIYLIFIDQLILYLPVKTTA